ncbi:hypothetical protein FGRMN_9971 [Fusarium graminum]|nr:hypothetical protein FGRMN_9971 [Fusarium graminum]
MSDNGRSLTDIITYIGVPLAVLGVLPILYNTLSTLVSLAKIKLNRVIEIELPRYAVKPLDRFQDRPEYWTLSRHPSCIPGGSWTMFNWKTHSIGMKTQRVEYADQVRQPQVEVAFDELVCYLLDLGAVPNPRAWKLLRSSGLWTPVGCCLMMSPEGEQDALTVAPSNDSDGNLSLAVTWSSSWITRNYSDLPPYWLRLPLPLQMVETGDNSGTSADISPRPHLDMNELLDKPNDGNENYSKSNKAITCQISMSGLATALTNQEHLSNSTAMDLEGLHIDHLRVHPIKSNGIWFASAATAFGTSSQTILWNYKIPDEILSFARKETVPCGVLVVLGVVDESETPTWATKHNDYGVDLQQFTKRSQEERNAIAEEARMPPAQRAAAAQARRHRDNERSMQDTRDKLRASQLRRDQRMMEALQSPRWDTKLVAEHSLRWLQGRGHWDESTTIKDAVGYILHRMVLDEEFAANICRMLDKWKAWADVGGMKQSDYQAVQDDQAGFAYATMLVAIIRDASTAFEGTVAMDLQECLRMWKKLPFCISKLTGPGETSPPKSAFAFGLLLFSSPSKPWFPHLLSTSLWSVDCRQSCAMDYRPNLYASICITLPIAALVLILRLLARRTTRSGYGIDDWLAVIAFIGALGYSVDNLVYVIGFGLGQPLKDGPSHLTEDQRLERSYILIWLSSLTYTIAIGGAKFAILAFYWRLFKYTWSRIPIQVVTILCGIWFLVRIFLLTLQCMPTSAYWDIARRATHCHVNNTIFFFSTGVTHAVLDVVILTLPIIEVVKMHLPPGQKLAVIALFGFGTLVCIFTILVIQDAFKFDGSSREIALRMAKHGALASAECNLANVSASLPMLRPVFRKIIPASFLASHKSKRAVVDSALSPNYGIKGSHGTRTTQQNGSSSMCEFAIADDIPPGYDIEASHAGWSYGTEISIFSPWRNQVPPESINEGLDGIQIDEETTVHVQRLG